VTRFIARVRTDAGIGTRAGRYDGRDRLAQRQHPGDEQPQKHPGHDDIFYLLTISSTNQATINYVAPLTDSCRASALGSFST